MDYEKKYKEAIEKVRSLHDNADEVSKLIDLKEELEAIFPELKESEDEKIRKELIQSFSDKDEEDYEGLHPRAQIVAWLEKPGEHARFLEAIQVGDKVTRNEDGVLVNLSQLKRVAKKDKKQGEQKPADKVEPKFKVGDIIRHKELRFICKITAVDTEYRVSGYNGTYLPFDSQDAYELVDQNPAWSEEDENINECIQWTLIDKQVKEKEPNKYNREINWLKDLKERVLPQPMQEWTAEDEEELKTALDTLVKAGQHSSAKWLKNVCLVPQTMQKPTEWSKEDKVMLGEIIDFFENGTVKLQHDLSLYASWLKSLRPQNTWKPSGEQMKALNTCIMQGEISYVGQGIELQSLYNDLKKLTE